MGIAYPRRPLAEPRSGRYAGCKSAAGEVFGCIPHGRGAYRESDSFAMWAVHNGVTVSMTTVSISSDPFIPSEASETVLIWMCLICCCSKQIDLR